MTQTSDTTTWWYEESGQRQGPVPQAELVRRLQTGAAHAGTLVWTAGMAQWAPISSVPALAEHLAAEPPPLPPEINAPSRAAPVADDFTDLLLTDHQISQNAAAKAALPADVRAKYMKKLAERHSGWAFFAGLVLWVLVLRLFNVHAWWVVVLLFLAAVGTTSSIFEHLQTKRLRDLSDALIEKEYDETIAREKQSKMLSRLAWIVGIAVVALVLALNDKLRNKLVQTVRLAASSADCKVENTTSVPTTFTVNGSPDFGYVVRGTVRNTGKAGDTEVNARLQTPEGEFKRTRQVRLAAGETRTLSFEFDEPSVQSIGDGKYGVTCRP